MGITMNPLVLSGLIAKRMKDLILDQMIGKKLVSVVKCKGDERIGGNYKETLLILKFSDSSSLHCFSPDCWATVRFESNLTDNLGVVSWANLAYEHKGGANDYGGSTTTTTLTLCFEDQTMDTYTFFGESNGYYDESVYLEWEGIKEEDN